MAGEGVGVQMSQCINPPKRKGEGSGEEKKSFLDAWKWHRGGNIL